MDRKKLARELSPWRLLLFILVLLLIAGGTSLFFGQTNDESLSAMSRFTLYLENNQIKQARSVYFEELFGDIELQAEAEAAALDALQVIQDDFHSGAINYERAEGSIRALEQSGIFLPTNKVDSAYRHINEDNESKLQFEAGRAAWASGHYMASAEAYREVDPQDPYYNLSQEGMKRSLEAYRDQVIKDAGALADEGEYLGSVSILEAALEQMPEDEALVDAYGTTLSLADDRYRQSMLDQARLAADNGDVVFSLHILDTAIDYLAELADSDIDVMADHMLRQANIQTDIRLLMAEAGRLRANIVNDASSAVDRLILNQSYLEALTVLDKSLALLPESRTLLTKQSELELALGYSFDTYLQATADLLALDPGLALLSEWRANFGDAVVELYPSPLTFPDERIEIWWLLPGANAFRTKVVPEYNAEILNELGLELEEFMMRVEVSSGNDSEVYELSLNGSDLLIDTPVNRREMFSLKAELSYGGEVLGDEVLDQLKNRHAVRLFLTESLFYNDGDFDAVADYRSYRAELQKREENAVAAKWQELVNLDLLPAPDEIDDDRALIEPLRLPNVQDREGLRYRESYLISGDTRNDLTWQSDSGFRRLRGTVAWLDPASLSHSMLAQIFIDDGVALRSQDAINQELQILVRSAGRPLLLYKLDGEQLGEAFELTLPFSTDSLTVSVSSQNDSDEAWAFILDMEVSR